VRTAKLTNSKKTKKSKSSRITPPPLAGEVFLFVDAGSSGSRINFALDPKCKLEDKDVSKDENKAVKLKYIF